MTAEPLETEQREIVREICEILQDAAPSGWATLEATWTALVGAGSLASISVRLQDGSSPGMNIPDGLNERCGRLKNMMYQPGRGTWLTLTIRLTPDGQPSVHFGYDEEIPDASAFLPQHFGKELARFPRDPEHIPGWLQELLDRVPNFYLGVYAEPGERYRGEIGPDLGEIAMAFDKAGWSVSDGEYSREFRFSTDWTSLQTLSHYGLVRMAGRIDPADWDRLIGFFTEQGWNFGATLYDGDDILNEVSPPRPTRE